MTLMGEYLLERRKNWIEHDCVATDNECCDACPYVVYDQAGLRKCDKEMYEQCNSEDFDEDYSVETDGD